MPNNSDASPRIIFRGKDKHNFVIDFSQILRTRRLHNYPNITHSPKHAMRPKPEALPPFAA